MTTPVVGIGASAGGLEAFKLLLAHLPANTGLAIVFAQHLDPKHHSNLSEILARVSAIPVKQATDGMQIEPNHLYVVPPDAELKIAGPVFRMTPRAPMASGPHLPIDRFLSSLAQESGSRAIGTMPQSAIGSGCVDWVLSPEAIAGELTKLGRHPYIAEDGDVGGHGSER